MSLSGFFNAPVSKGLLLVTVGSTVLAQLTSARQASYQLTLAGLYGGQLWRFITSQLAFGTPSELIVGLMLSYMARTFERQMGSRKFGAFVLFSSAVGATLQATALMYLRKPRQLSSGPYNVMFALMVLYYAGSPKVQPKLMGLFGVDLSEKFLTYLMALKLAVTGGWESAVPAMAGILAGCAYRSDTLGIHRWRVPSFLARLVAPLKLVFGSNRPAGLPGDASAAMFDPTGRRHNGRGNGNMGTPGRERLIGDPFGALFAGGNGGGAPRQPTPAPQPPSEADIETIVAMGFDRDAAVRALTQHGNVERAINSLLS